MVADDGERIVDAALEIADAAGWKAVRLRAVADRLDLPLARIYRHFPDLDALATAWLARADRAMLARGACSDLAELPAPERLQGCIMAWISALEGRRGVLRDVLAYRLAPPHVHLQAALLVATSRRVQWLREAAGLDARGGRKSLEEAGLTALFVATVLVWLCDGSADARRTRSWLARRLARADRLMARLFPPPR